MRPFDTSDPVHSFLNTHIPFISSIFGSHARLARFLLLLIFLNIAMLFPSIEKKRHQRILFISLTLSLVGVFLSGQRTSMYLLPIGIVGFIVLILFGRGKIRVNRSVLQIFIAGIGLILVISSVIFVWFPDLGDYFLHYTSVLERFTEFVPSDIGFALSRAGINGMGFGIASQGLQYVATFTDLKAEVGVESGIGKVWYELGFPGMIAFMLFCFALIYYMTKRIWQYPNKSSKSLVAAVTLYYLSILFDFLFLHHQAMGDATSVIPLWFYIGVIFGIERWESESVG